MQIFNFGAGFFHQNFLGNTVPAVPLYNLNCPEDKVSNLFHDTFLKIIGNQNDKFKINIESAIIFDDLETIDQWVQQILYCEHVKAEKETALHDAFLYAISKAKEKSFNLFLDYPFFKSLAKTEECLHTAALTGNGNILEKLVKIKELEVLSEHPLISPLNQLTLNFLVQEIYKNFSKKFINESNIGSIELSFRNKRAEIVKALIAAGVNFNQAKDVVWDGNTAKILVYVAHMAHIDEIKKLIAEKFFNERSDWIESLTYAAGIGLTQEIKSLIDLGIDGNTALGRAIENGDLGALKTLLSAGVSGQELLFKAVINGRVGLVKKLLAAGIDVNQAKSDGWTALMYAAWNGHTEVAKALLKAGANVNQAKVDGSTALMLAAFNNHAESVKAVLRGGADVNQAKADGWTALMSAAWNGHTEVAKALLAAGANVDQAKVDGSTALMLAAFNDRTEVVKALLEGGADVNQAKADGWTALMVVAQNGRLGVVRALLEGGANVNQKSWFGFGSTALEVARNHADVIKFIRAAGGGVNQFNFYSLISLITSVLNLRYISEFSKEMKYINLPGIFFQLQYPFRKSQGSINNEKEFYYLDLFAATVSLLTLWQGMKEVKNDFLYVGSKISKATTFKATLLMMSFQERHLKFAKNIVNARDYTNQVAKDLVKNAVFGNHQEIKNLLSLGSDSNESDLFGITALMVAISKHQLESAKALIEGGAKINYRTLIGSTPLILSIQQAQIDLTRLLLNKGANVNYSNLMGATPLIAAVQNDQFESARLLIEYGANVDQTDLFGNTALMIAIEKGNLDMINLLLSKGGDTYKRNKFGVSAAIIAEKKSG